MSCKWNHTAYILLWLAFFQLIIMLLWSVFVVVYIGIFLLLLNNIPLYGYITVGLFIPPFDGHWSFPHLLVIVNSATVNIQVQVLMWTFVFNSLRSVPMSRITESYNKYMFNFIGNCQTVSRGGCTFFLRTVFENYSDWLWWYSHGL